MISEVAHRSHKLAGSLLALVLALGLGGRARADEPGEEKEAAPAAALIAEAIAEYEAARFEEARVLFRRAQDQSPSARTLRGIGMASFEVRDYVEAVRTLAAALREERHALTPEQRRHVDGLLARAEAFVGRFTLVLPQSDASVTVDDGPVRREADGTLLLQFGRHVIVTRCTACVSAPRQLEVLGGERRNLELGFPTPAAMPEPAATVERRDADEAPAGARLAPGHWMAGVAAVAAAGSVGSFAWWRSRASELDKCRVAGDLCHNPSTVAGEGDLALAATIGLGAVAVTTGIVAALLWPHAGPPPRHAVACAGTAHGGSCALRF
jgi:hypothetical protein